jgi:hypothetical protein
VNRGTLFALACKQRLLYYYFVREQYTRNFTLSLVYRFGGYKKKETKEVDTSRFGH